MILALLAIAAAQSTPVNRGAPQVYRPRNVIVVVLDDVGTEQLGIYGTPAAWGETHARMPVLDQLRAQGVMFRQAWASPLCSPSRAMLLTGRHGFRTGMMGVAETPGPCPPGTISNGPLACCPETDPECSQPGSVAILPLHPMGYSLPDSEITIAESLRDAVLPGGARYTSGAFGKWHLSAPPGDPCHPIQQGFEVFAGHLFNNENDAGHFEWWRETARATQSGCATASSLIVGQWDAERTALDARAWMDSVMAENPPRSFFAWVCFNPPHWPFQVPPRELVSVETWNELVAAGLDNVSHREAGVRSCQAGTQQEFDSRAARLVYRASLEAVDTLIGRVVFRSPTDPFPLENTVVFVVGDNGTPDQVASSTQDATVVLANAQPVLANHSKRQVFELGIHVPLVVAGSGVAHGADCNALVSAVDLWATVLDIAGVEPALPPEAVDGQSFRARLVSPTAPYLPSDREQMYAEVASRNGLVFDRATTTWSPVAPGGKIEYQRAVLETTGYKHIRRVVGVDPVCALASSPCDISPESEIYRLFDAVGDLDVFESHPLCGDPTAEVEAAYMRTLIETLYSGW